MVLFINIHSTRSTLNGFRLTNAEGRLKRKECPPRQAVSVDTYSCNSLPTANDNNAEATTNKNYDSTAPPDRSTTLD